MAVVKKTNAVGALVDQVCAANGWSKRDIARRAQSKGHELSHQRISQMCVGELPGIQADKLHALAVGLGVSSVRVGTAVLEAMGVPVVDTSVSPAEAILRAPELSADTRSALLAILRSSRTPARS